MREAKAYDSGVCGELDGRQNIKSGRDERFRQSSNTCRVWGQPYAGICHTWRRFYHAPEAERSAEDSPRRRARTYDEKKRCAAGFNYFMVYLNIVALRLMRAAWVVNGACHRASAPFALGGHSWGYSHEEAAQTNAVGLPAILILGRVLLRVDSAICAAVVGWIRSSWFGSAAPQHVTQTDFPGLVGVWWQWCVGVRRLMVGHGEFNLAIGAGLLLAVNMVCVNLATKIVFLAKKVNPRTWWQKEQARRAMMVYLIIWLVTLSILIFAIYMRRPFH